MLYAAWCKNKFFASSYSRLGISKYSSLLISKDVSVSKLDLLPSLYVLHESLFGGTSLLVIGL